MAIGTERVSGVLALSMKPLLLRARSFENPSGSWGEPDPLSALNHQICRRIVSAPPERLSGAHLGLHDDRSGRKKQLGFRADFRLCFDFIDSRKRKLSPFICTKFLGTHLRLGKSRWTEVSLGVSTTSRRSASWYSKPLIYPGQWCLAESSTVILRENRRGAGGTRRGVGLCRSV